MSLKNVKTDCNNSLLLNKIYKLSKKKEYVFMYLLFDLCLLFKKLKHHTKNNQVKLNKTLFRLKLFTSL